MKTETEIAITEAKAEIEQAVQMAAGRLRDKTGLLATVTIETLNVDTWNSQGRLYVARLGFSVGGTQ